MPSTPKIQDGNIPSGSRSILFKRPSDASTFTLVAEDFSPDKNPITMTGRNDDAGDHSGGTGRTGMITGTATVQNIFDNSGDVVLVQPGDCFTEDEQNYCVLTAPAPEKNTEDQKQSITFYGVANPSNFKVDGVAVDFPIEA